MKSIESNPEVVEEVRAERASPAQGGVERPILRVAAEARDIGRVHHEVERVEPVLAPGADPREERADWPAVIGLERDLVQQAAPDRCDRCGGRPAGRRVVGPRVEAEDGGAGRIDERRRNDVAGKRHARARVVDLPRIEAGRRIDHAGERAREVSAAPWHRGHCCHPGERLAHPRAFIAAEDEQPVSNERAAERRPELIALELRDVPGRVVEIVARVEGGVPVELVGRASPPVGAAPGHEIELAAGAPAVLRGIVGGLHLELLDGVHRRHHDDLVDVEVVVVDAVEQEVVGLLPRPVDAHGSALGRVLRSFRRQQRAGHERGKLEEVTAIEGKADDPLVVDDGADRGHVGLDERHDLGDGDLLRDASEFQREVDPRPLIDLEFEPGPDRPLEPGQRCFEPVAARRQEQQFEVAGRARDDRAPDAGCFVDDRNGRAGERAAGQVPHAAQDRACGRLRTGGGGRDEQKEDQSGRGLVPSSAARRRRGGSDHLKRLRCRAGIDDIWRGTRRAARGWSTAVGLMNFDSIGDRPMGGTGAGVDLVPLAALRSTANRGVHHV